MICKEDFTQFAKDTHLLDFETNMGDASPMALLSPRKTRKQPQTPTKGQDVEEDPDEKVLHCTKKSRKFSRLESDCTVHSVWVRIPIRRIAVQKYSEIDPRIGIVSN